MVSVHVLPGGWGRGVYGSLAYGQGQIQYTQTQTSALGVVGVFVGTVVMVGGVSDVAEAGIPTSSAGARTGAVGHANISTSGDVTARAQWSALVGAPDPSWRQLPADAAVQWVQAQQPQQVDWTELNSGTN